jgi:3-oxoacyl-[acyl-carrier-protein] synthase III
MIPLYLSAPGVVLPELARTNEDQLAEVRARFRGDEAQWEAVRRRLEFVFRLCNSQRRYYAGAHEQCVADHAVAASRRCLDALGISSRQLDLVINGSLVRDYYEPATATEIAGKLGIERTHAFDVTSACSGLLQAVHTAAAFMHMHDDIEYALVCAADLTTRGISFDIQDKDDVAVRSAGLTLGDGASAFVVSRTPLRLGGRLLGISTQTLPQHHHLCSAPISGTFTSHSAELFRLHQHLPAHIRELLRRCGKTPDMVDRWICHQPSDAIIAKIAEALELPRERFPTCHAVFGNTVNSTVPMTLDHVLHQGPIAPGELLLLGGAAAGFTMVTMLLEWAPAEARAHA